MPSGALGPGARPPGRAGPPAEVGAPGRAGTRGRRPQRRLTAPYVVAERDGATVGDARFHNTVQWDITGARGTIVLRDLEARDRAGYATPWRFLLEIAPTSTLGAQNRPVDDAWQHLVSDVQRRERRLRYGLFVRLVDVGAALEAGVWPRCGSKGQ
ncbi:hypothetical protein ACFV30_14255 [Streptomyces sp. NPDC059752]|uniref:hypothetical protein n=1 Tax=unclassified Streptomyces TaxID=2593676 RepID=UPI003669E644